MSFPVTSQASLILLIRLDLFWRPWEFFALSPGTLNCALPRGQKVRKLEYSEYSEEPMFQCIFMQKKMKCLNSLLHNNRKGDNQMILYNAQLKLKLVEEGVLERLSQIWVFLAARVCVSCNWCRIGGDFLCLDNERSSPEIISHFLDLGSNFDRRGGEVRSWQYPDLLKNIQSDCKISWPA